MAANPHEEARVRAVIAGRGLPDPRCAIDFGTNPFGTMGVYRASIDTMQLPLNAPDQTLIHEASHAEHHHAAGLAGAQYPTDAETVVGLGVLSEAFVGFRLLPAAGFLAFEYGRVREFAFRTAIDFAAWFKNVAAAQGGGYVRNQIMTVEIFKVLLFLLPLIVAEATDTRPRQLAAGLTATSRHPNVTGTGVVLLRAIQDVLRIVEVAQQHSPPMVGTALSTRMTMTLVGDRLLADLEGHGIYP
jgi:hypothetical protein